MSDQPPTERYILRQQINEWQQRCYQLVDEKEGLERRLAEAAVRIKYLEGYEEQYKIEHEQLGEARALLEEVGNNQEVGVADGDCDSMCFFCGGDEGKLISSYPFLHEYDHRPDCAWVKIRAFLQKLSG